MSEQEGLTIKKAENFSEWYSQLVQKADLADIRYNVQGFIVHRPWAMQIFKHMFSVFEKELELNGHKPVLFPLVIPEENFQKEKEHVEFTPEVFWITEAGVDGKLEKRLALRPTSETAFYQMYSIWIRSYRDLPLKLYQSVSVYRHEPVTRPFIRGREFLWIEAHDAFANHDEALKQVRWDMHNSQKIIWEQLGIPFLFFKRPAWDKFKGADDTYAADTLLPDGRVLQISSTHDLGTRFAKAFGVKFADEKGQEEYAWQTCYGPGIWRIFAALIALHGDDKGLVLPFDFAPVQVVIVPIFYSDEDKEKVMKRSRELESLLKKEFRGDLDLSSKTPGEKYNYWELRGVPFRIEIGPKEADADFVTLVRRDTKSKKKVENSKLIEGIKLEASSLLEELKKRAKDYFDNNVNDIKNKEGLAKLYSKAAAGFAKVNFCGRETCAMEIQEATSGAKVRGTPLDSKETPSGKCIWCGQQAEEVVYLAKSY